MNEREQVISNLLYMKRDCLEGSDTDKTLDRAIALLKAREPGWISVKDRLPELDAMPVVHARWIKGGYACGENEYKCSACGETEWRTGCARMKYCMCCGAKMDLEEQHD